MQECGTVLDINKYGYIIQDVRLQFLSTRITFQAIVITMYTLITIAQHLSSYITLFLDLTHLTFPVSLAVIQQGTLEIDK